MKLLITRPEKSAKILSDKLRASGHETVCSALLEIVFNETTDLDLKGVQAFVVTSANGLAGLVKVTENRDLPLFAVGDKTAKAAKYAGFKTVLSADGDVAGLGDLISQNAAIDKGTLLHAGGARVAGDLGSQLEVAGFSYRREILYDAIEAEKFSSETFSVVSEDKLDGILLFSPHTAKVFKRIVDAEGLNTHLEKLDAWCLSANVASEIEGLKFGRVFVSRRPTEEALLQLIEKNPATDIDEQTRKPDRQREHTVSKTPKQEATANTAANKPDDQSKSAVNSPIPEAKTAGNSDGAGKTMPPKSGPAVVPPKSNILRNAAILFFVFCLGLAAWPLILPQVSNILPEQSRNILQGYLGAQGTDKLLDDRIVKLEGVIAANSTAKARSEQNLMEISALKSQVEQAASKTQSDLTAFADRLASAEGQAHDLQVSLGELDAEVKAAPGQIAAAPASDPTASAPIVSGVSRAEINRLETELTTLAKEFATLQRDQVLATTEFADQQSQIGTLSDALKAQAVRASQNNENGDETLILLALGQLHRESRTNQPFAGALRQALAVAPEALQGDLASMNSAAKTGAATVRELTEEFAAVATDSAQAARLPSSDTWYGKTLHNLASLVKFRRVDDVSGEGVDALVARAEEKILAGDLSEGVELLKKLSDEPAKVAAPWLMRAENRLNVDTALERLLEKVTATAVLEKQTAN